MRSGRLLSLVLLAVLPAAGAPILWAGESSTPLGLEQVRKLILLPAPDGAISGEITSRGIAFEPSDETIATLQRVGAKPQTLAALRSIRKTIDGAPTRIPELLTRIYDQLNQGSVRSLSDVIAPGLLADYARLDSICPPSSFRAYIIEKTVDRPGGAFEVYVRVLRRPTNEHAYKLLFRALPEALRLEGVDSSEEALTAWFQPQLTVGAEAVRRLVWAAKNAQADVVAGLMSPTLPATRLFAAPLTSVWNFETVQIDRPELSDMNGLKVLVPFRSSGKASMRGEFLVEVNADIPRVVWWRIGTYSMSNPVEDRDPQMEARTLARFKLAEAPAEGQPSANRGPQTRQVLLTRSLAAIDSGDYEEGAGGLDELLATGGVVLPVGREKTMGLDRWVLVFNRQQVALNDENAVEKVKAPMADVEVEGVGSAQPDTRVAPYDSSPGAYVRLKLKGKSYSLYYWPIDAQCNEATRSGLSFAHFPQCGRNGAKVQEFVAQYVVSRIQKLKKSNP